MELQQQVTSLELSKRMKELGFKQKSYFYYIDGMIWDRTMQSDYESVYTPPRNKWISAFTVAELGEMIKEIQNKIDCGDVCYDLTFENKKPTIGWSGNNHEENADTESDARAKMLCYLKENKLI